MIPKPKELWLLNRLSFSVSKEMYRDRYEKYWILISGCKGLSNWVLLYALSAFTHNSSIELTSPNEPAPSLLITTKHCWENQLKIVQTYFVHLRKTHWDDSSVLGTTCTVHKNKPTKQAHSVNMFLLTASPLNQILGQWEYWKWSPISEAPERQSNSPGQYHGKCKENSLENKNTNLRVYGVKRSHSSESTPLVQS